MNKWYALPLLLLLWWAWPSAAHATSCALDGDTSAAAYKDCVPARVMWSSNQVDETGKQEFFNTPQDLAAAFLNAWRAQNTTYCATYQCYVTSSTAYVNNGMPGAPPILMSYNFVIKTVLPPSLFSTTVGLSNIRAQQSVWCSSNNTLAFVDAVVGTPNYGAAMCRPVAGLKAARPLKGDVANPAGCTSGCNPVDLGDQHKTDWVVDYQNQSPYPIVWARSYNGLSHQWFFNYDRKLIASPITAGALTAVATLRRQDGQVLTFLGTRASASTPWTWSANVGSTSLSAQVLGTLTSANDLSSFTFLNHQDETESYNAAGQLTQIQDPRGLPLTFTYDSRGRLSQVTDASGRSLSVTYPTVVAPTNGTYANGSQGSSQVSYVTYTNGTDSWVESFPDTVSDGTRNVGYAWIIQPSSNPAVAVLNQVIKPDGHTQTYNYDTAGQYLGLTDENNARYSTYSYGSSDTVVQTYHGAQNETLGYAQGAVTFPNGQTMNYSTAAGVSKTTSQSSWCSWCGGTQYQSIAYDASANPSSLVNFNNQTETRVYDPVRGVPTSVTEAAGTPQARTTTLTWDSRFLKPTQVVRPAQTPQGVGTLTTSATYDGQGNLTAWSRTAAGPGGYSVTRSGSATYNTFGEPLTQVDARGNTRSYAYDNQGNRVQTTDEAGHVRTYGGYDSAGNVGWVQDANGLRLVFTYDALQRITQIQKGCDPTSGATCHWETTTIAYDPMGKVAQVVGANGRGLAYHYDTAHRLTQTDMLASNGSVLGSEFDTLDASSEITQRTFKDASGNVIQTQGLGYDTLSRVTAVVDSHGNTFSQSWDAQSNPLVQADPLNNQRTQAYDALDRLVQTTEADGSQEQQVLGLDDTVLSQTDAAGHTTTQTFNGFGEVVARTSPDSGTTTYTRDANGNVLTQTDARGVTLTTTYDALNRPLTQTGSTAQEQITWAYDTCTNGVGRLCTVTDRTGTTAFTYDRWGRQASKTVLVLGQTLTVGYAYDNAGQLIALTYPSGQVLNQTWSNGRVVTQAWGANPVLSSVQYDPWNTVQGWTWGSGRGFSLAYDQDGRISAIGAGAGAASQTYSYDNGWRLASIARQPAAATTTFTYDARNRLTSGSTWGSYTYDANSNRLTWLGALGPMAYTYTAGTNQLSGLNGNPVAVDAAGNLLSRSGLALTYDDWRRVRSATLNGATWTYGVNGLHEQVSRQGGTNLIYVYASVGHLLGVYNATTGQPVEELAYLGDRPVATVRSGQVYPVETDHLMAPLRVLDASNNVVWSWEDREPFGASAPTSPSGFVFDLRFPGQWADDATGLVSNGHRDYDPTLGRYLETDPLGLMADMNVYAYVSADPLRFWDILGLQKAIWLRNGGSGVPLHQSVALGEDNTFTEISFGTDSRLSWLNPWSDDKGSIYLMNENGVDMGVNNGQYYELTDDQYNALLGLFGRLSGQGYGQYSLFANNCRDFSQRLLANVVQSMGLTPTPVPRMALH